MSSRMGWSCGGEVISETPEQFIIRLEERDGISGQTRVTKEQIAKRTRIPDDEIAFLRLPKISLHPRHSLSPKDYNTMISAAEVFVEKFPQSPYAPEVGKTLEAAREERQRVSRGEVKSAGEWLSQVQATFLAYDVKANLLYDEILDFEERGLFLEAKRVFDQLERTYPGSLAYFQAGAKMTQWLDRQVKSKGIEINALEQRESKLSKGRDDNNRRIADAQSKLSRAGSPAYATSLKNQIASLQSQNAVMEREINGLQTQLSAARTVLAEYSAELSRLRSLAFQNASQQANALKQIEEKFRAGRLSEVKELLKNAELRPFERTRNLNALMEGHDQILQKMRSEIAASKFDAAIETGNQGLKQYPGSDQITALIEQARTARSEAARAVQ
ncbi:hypothetical protein QQ054_08385 [Oscillatoria amoena NRMC-F 0135]|nr:hypothetical protein [Oscillatoria amoena NRMC-F 0135]